MAFPPPMRVLPTADEINETRAFYHGWQPFNPARVQEEPEWHGELGSDSETDTVTSDDDEIVQQSVAPKRTSPDHPSEGEEEPEKKKPKI